MAPIAAENWPALSALRAMRSKRPTSSCEPQRDGEELISRGWELPAFFWEIAFLASERMSLNAPFPF